jgi:hypothetical protein
MPDRAWNIKDKLMANWDHDDLRDRSGDTSVWPVTQAVSTLTPVGNITYGPLGLGPLGLGQKETFDVGEVIPTFAPRPTVSFNYRYSEGKHMEEFKKYVDTTYNAHYVGKTQVQALDMWESLGNLFTSSRDTAIKYLCRVKKKGCKEDYKKDILKTMHYCLFMLHALENDDK